MIFDFIRQLFLRSIEEVGDKLSIIKNLRWFYINNLSIIAVALCISLSNICLNPLFALEKDIRAIKLHKFLIKQNSPLVGHENEIIHIADVYKLDWRLYVAISGAESSFGKRCIPGYRNFTGIGSGYVKFSSIYSNILETHKLIGTKRYYERYRKSKKLTDLVYVWKGVKPWEPYTSNLRIIMNKINEEK
jgi:hypothetical protein